MALARYERAIKSLEELLGDAAYKFNPNHDPDNGQFSEWPGGGGGAGVHPSDITESSDSVDSGADAYLRKGLGSPQYDDAKGVVWGDDVVSRAKHEAVSSIAESLDDNEYFTKNNIRWVGVPTVAERKQVFADGLVHDWAESSGDMHASSLANQFAANEEFGTDSANEFIVERWKNMQVKAPKYFESSGMKARRNALRTMYANTQKQLKAAHVDYVTLYRGVGSSADHIGEHEEATINSNPLESWTTNPNIAMRFGHNTLKARVHRSRILSTAKTGFGCLNENEYVVIMKKGDKVRKVPSNL